MNGKRSADLRPWKLAIRGVKPIFGVDDGGSLLANLLDDVIAGVADNHAAVYAAIVLRHDGGGRTSEHHFGYLVCLTEGLLPGLEHGALGWGFRNWLRLHKTRPLGCAVVRRRRWLACTGVHGGQCRGRRLAACGARATHAGRSHGTGRRCAGRCGTSRSRAGTRSEEHTSELQSLRHLVCRLLLDK